MIHENSLTAYLEEKEEGRLGTRADDILQYIKKIKYVTARDIMVGLCYSDMNQVRPRLTELKQAGLIIEVDKIRDNTTNKLVSVFDAK